MKKRLLVTGSSGLIAGIIMPQLEELFDVRTLDIIDNGRTDFPVDLADYPKALPAFEGVDAVIHLAADKNDKPFDKLWKPNYLSTSNVFRAAEEHDVKRIVYASSVRIDEGRLFNRDGTLNAENINTQTGRPKRMFSEHDLPLPINPYGYSKVYGEYLATRFVLALADTTGRSAVSVRFGAVQSSDDLPAVKSELNKFTRYCWLSQRDLINGMDTIMGLCYSENTAFHLICYLVSKNACNVWSPQRAVKLGYKPRDNIEKFASQLQDVFPLPLKK